MQCFIYRLVVAFPPVKCFHFWWLIVKESNALITGKGFLVSLSSCCNFCCSPCQAHLQREVLHQLRWCPELRMAQTRGSVGHKGPAGRPPAKGPAGRPWAVMSQGTCDRHDGWICSSSSRGSVFPRVSWPRWGGWAGGMSSARCHHKHQLCQITQCLSLWANRYPHFPSTCTCRKGGSLICVQRGSTSDEQLWSQDLSWMAKEGQVGCPSLTPAKMGRQWTYTLFCFCSLYLTQAFIFRDIS